MLDSIQTLLDAFPEGVIQVRDGRIAAANAQARRLLPGLEQDGTLPDCILLPRAGQSGRGTFAAAGGVFAFSCTNGGEEQVILLREGAQTALTAGQLDGALYQLRTLLGDMLAEAGPATRGGPLDRGNFGKTFHRLFRLLGNLEYMRDAAGEEVPFRPVAMDLNGLCRHVVELAGPLLAQAGVALNCHSGADGLLIPGDPALLHRLLLGLIANGAREERELALTLRRAGQRAVLTLSGRGADFDEKKLAALAGRSGADIPLPGQGAGLGLDIARHIVTLHGGAMMVEWGQGSPGIILSLPTGPLDGRATVFTAAVQRDGGLDLTLVELADVLPAEVFGLEGLD